MNTFEKNPKTGLKFEITTAKNGYLVNCGYEFYVFNKFEDVVNYMAQTAGLIDYDEAIKLETQEVGK